MHFLHVHKICKLLIGIGVVLLSASCADNQYDNSCYLIFDNSTNNNSKVAAAMTISSNVFVTFSKKSINGKPYFHIESNQGGTDDVAFTYQDQQRGYIFGKNNGVIVGFGILDNQFKAYDLLCPNCYNESKYKNLTVNSNGQTYCSNCKRYYDLSTGLVASGEGGKAMIQYRASSSGPNGTLVIN